jgi:hypothetical protein
MMKTLCLNMIVKAPAMAADDVKRTIKEIQESGV